VSKQKLPSQRDEGDTQHVYSTWSKNVFELEIGAMVCLGEENKRQGNGPCRVAFWDCWPCDRQLTLW